MQNPLKYTVDEIARMRAAVEYLTGKNGAEDRLRTYMQNGTTADELVAAEKAERSRRMDLNGQRVLRYDAPQSLGSEAMSPFRYVY